MHDFPLCNSSAIAPDFGPANLYQSLVGAYCFIAVTLGNHITILQHHSINLLFIILPHSVP